MWTVHYAQPTRLHIIFDLTGWRELLAWQMQLEYCLLAADLLITAALRKPTWTCLPVEKL